MWTVGLWVALAAAAGDKQVEPAVEAPEPILELAQRDLRATRTARGALALSAVAPGMVYFGLRALGPLFEASLDLNAAGAGLLITTGFAGMVAMPLFASARSQRARRALRDQGLSVRKVAPWTVTTALSVAAPITLLASQSTRPAGVALGLGLYGGAVAITAVQMSTNRRARKDAGWLGLTPMIAHGAGGVALGGSW
jgi:hypothetical protein